MTKTTTETGNEPQPAEMGSREAMELLVDAVAKEIRPGVLELKLAARTLREALDNPTPGALALATKAFNAIDHDTRARIQRSVLTAATQYHTRSGGTVSIPETLRPTPKKS